MKLGNILNIVLAIAVVIVIYFIAKNVTPERIIETVVERDTLVQVDTVKVPKIIYVTKINAKIDTVFIDSSKTIIARADTVLQSDSSRIKVSYYFPPKNFFEIAFEIKEKIIKELKTITEIKTVTIEQPWYKDTWFYTTIISLLILIMGK